MTLAWCSALLAQVAEDLSQYRMRPMGWVFMVASIAAVTALVVFCYYKVLTGKSPEERMHAPLEIDTRDKDT